ncbi:hypothetical protein ACWG8W_07585 [Citricoccus zhacaiensis]
MGTVTKSVAVQLTTAGMPMRVQIEGRIYTVAAEPLHWYERRKWWTEEHRAERGRGAGLVDHEVWQLQVQLSQRAPLHTIELRRHEQSGRWELIRIHDRGEYRTIA